jgi:hypothetical protein
MPISTRRTAGWISSNSFFCGDCRTTKYTRCSTKILKIKVKKTNRHIYKLETFDKNCEIKQQGGQQIFRHNESGKVGDLCFDDEEPSQYLKQLCLLRCAVDGMEIDDVSDCDETYYIMIVRQFLSEENRHERVGVGTINADYGVCIQEMC